MIIYSSKLNAEVVDTASKNIFLNHFENSDLHLKQLQKSLNLKITFKKIYMYY